jgi:hypothetical protein
VEILINLNVQLRYALNLRGPLDYQAYLDLPLLESVIDLRHLAGDFIQGVRELCVNVDHKTLREEGGGLEELAVVLYVCMLTRPLL